MSLSPRRPPLPHAIWVALVDRDGTWEPVAAGLNAIEAQAQARAHWPLGGDKFVRYALPTRRERARFRWPAAPPMTARQILRAAGITVRQERKITRELRAVGLLTRRKGTAR